MVYLTSRKQTIMPKNNPHNALFVKTFSIRSEAKAFIQQFLPKWISDSIDCRTFKQATTSYVYCQKILQTA